MLSVRPLMLCSSKLPNLVLYIRAHLLRLIVYEALDVFVWAKDNLQCKLTAVIRDFDFAFVSFI